MGHVYNENANDVFFMDISIKSYSGFVKDIADGWTVMEATSETLGEYSIGIRAYSLTRNIWIKDFSPLPAMIDLLKSEVYLS